MRCREGDVEEERACRIALANHAHGLLALDLGQIPPRRLDRRPVALEVVSLLALVRVVVGVGVEVAPEMVEALGINVRIIFTLVFALGVALASLGGILAAPSTGLSIEMGTRVLLLALIALAIGGLTSFPGAAVGAVLVGLLHQFFF